MFKRSPIPKANENVRKEVSYTWEKMLHKYLFYMVKTIMLNATFQRFQPASLTNGLAVVDAGNMDLREDEERRLGFAYREPTMPDISLLHGRMLVSAWEFGLESGDLSLDLPKRSN